MHLFSYRYLYKHTHTLATARKQTKNRNYVRATLSSCEVFLCVSFPYLFCCWIKSLYTWNAFLEWSSSLRCSVCVYVWNWSEMFQLVISFCTITCTISGLNVYFLYFIDFIDVDWNFVEVERSINALSGTIGRICLSLES